jgi:hypothetical protein
MLPASRQLLLQVGDTLGQVEQLDGADRVLQDLPGGRHLDGGPAAIQVPRQRRHGQAGDPLQEGDSVLDELPPGRTELAGEARLLELVGQCPRADPGLDRGGLDRRLGQEGGDGRLLPRR